MSSDELLPEIRELRALWPDPSNPGAYDPGERLLILWAKIYRAGIAVGPPGLDLKSAETLRMWWTDTTEGKKYRIQQWEAFHAALNEAEEKVKATRATLQASPAGESAAGTQDAAAGGDDDDQGAAHCGVTWQDVAQCLERLRASGEPYTTQRDLAKRLGVPSVSTVNKAIKETPSLHPWAKPQSTSAPKAERLSAVVTDNTPQQREPDPADLMTDDEVEIIFRKMIEDAPTAEERAEWHKRFSELSPDEKRRFASQYADATDLGFRVIDRKP